MRIYKAKNGITLLYKRIKSSNSVDLQICFDNGSTSDGKKFGITHLLEHNLLIRTKTMTHEEIREFNSKYNLSLNAHTSLDILSLHTYSSVKMFEKSMELLSEFLSFPMIEEKAFENEKHVVAQEINLFEDNVEDLANKNFFKLFFKDKDFVKRLGILGSKEDVLSYTKKDIIDHFKNNFGLNNMYIVVSGNVSFRTALTLSKRYLFNLDLNKVKMDYLKYRDAKVDKVPRLEFAKTNQSKARVDVIFSTDIEIKDIKKSAILDFIAYKLHSESSKYLRDKYGICYNCGCMSSGSDYNTNLAIFLYTSEKQVNKAIDCCSEFVSAMKNRRITLEDLTNYKLAKHLQMDKRLVKIGDSGFKLIYNYLSYGKEVSLEKIMNIIDKVTIDEVNEVFDEVFKNIPYISVVANMDKKDVMPYSEIKKLF